MSRGRICFRAVAVEEQQRAPNNTINQIPEDLSKNELCLPDFEFESKLSSTWVFLKNGLIQQRKEMHCHVGSRE